MTSSAVFCSVRSVRSVAVCRFFSMYKIQCTARYIYCIECMALCVFTVNTQCVVSINEKALNGTPHEIVFETKLRTYATSSHNRTPISLYTRPISRRWFHLQNMFRSFIWLDPNRTNIETHRIKKSVWKQEFLVERNSMARTQFDNQFRCCSIFFSVASFTLLFCTLVEHLMLLLHYWFRNYSICDTQKLE